MAEAEDLVSWMAQGAEHHDIQLVQTRFKRQLAEAWRIPPDARVLEIGCGQGDMTAVLADAVGPRGHVTAMDIADPTYGAPISLGDSARHLLDSPLGSRIDFRFSCDVLDPSVTFEAAAFDCVVLAHSSWYFGSVDQLRDVLARVRPWAKRLYFSEWTMTPTTIEQVAHMLAVLLQGQLEAFKTTSEANIRTPISKATFLRRLRATGWTPVSEAVLQAPQLQDASWEVAHCLGEVSQEVSEIELPRRLTPLFESQLDVLRLLASEHPMHSLASFAIVAE